MDKDEMKKDLINILKNQCDNAPFDYCYGCDCNECRARTVINAGYYKVGKGEQIVNTEQLNETLNSTLESEKRIGYARGQDETITAVLKYIDNTIEDVNREKEEDKYEDEDEKAAQLIIADAINVVLRIVRDDLARIYGIEVEEE